MIDVVINGTGPLGRMVFHLLSSDERYRVRAFTAPAQYCSQEELLGVPLCAHDDLVARYPPDDLECLSVLGGLGGWTDRKEHFDAMRTRGYRHATYIHPTAVIQDRLDGAENNIVFPFAMVGFGGRMGSNNIIREKVYLGHDFVMGDHTFLGVGATIGGGCNLGTGAYVAMASTVTNDVSVGAGAFVGIGSLLLKDAEADGLYIGHPAHLTTARRPSSADAT